MLEVKMPNIIIDYPTVEDLKIGDLFLYENFYVCMKIETVKGDEFQELNCVCLNTSNVGNCWYISEDEKVLPLKGVLGLDQNFEWAK